MMGLEIAVLVLISILAGIALKPEIIKLVKYIKNKFDQHASKQADKYDESFEMLSKIHKDHTIAECFENNAAKIDSSTLIILQNKLKNNEFTVHDFKNIPQLSALAPTISKLEANTLLSKSEYKQLKKQITHEIKAVKKWIKKMGQEGERHTLFEFFENARTNKRNTAASIPISSPTTSFRL